MQALLVVLALQFAPQEPEAPSLPKGAIHRLVCKGEVTGRGAVFYVAFAPDGQRIVTGIRLGYLQRWDGSGKELLQVTPGSGCLSLAVSPDGKRGAAGDFSGTTIRVWDLETGKALADLDEQVDQSRSLAFSPDGQFLASGG